MVSSNHSNPHPPMKFMRSLEKGFVRFVMNILIRNIITKDTLLILHQERKDELMAFVFHKERKKDVHEESIKVEDKGSSKKTG